MKIKQETLQIMGVELNGVNPLPSFRARKCKITVPDENFPENLKELPRRKQRIRSSDQLP